MTIQVALVEYTPKNSIEINTSSGLVFSGKFVLITGHVLLPFLKQFGLDNWINNHPPGIIHYNIFQQHTTPKLRVITKNSTESVKYAEVIAGFLCQNIIKTCHNHLEGWAIEFENNIYHSKELLSLFFVLEISDNPNRNNTSTGRKLNQALLDLLHDAGKCLPNIGHEVFIESVPFGNKIFLNSYSKGIISNIVGENSSLLLSDCPSVPGSEGSPVFIQTDSGRSVIAIVLSSVNWWKGEWIGLTLTANLVPLLLQFKELCVGETGNGRCSCIPKKLIGVINNCLVQIMDKSSWGTAILVHKQKGIFLTNSHVVTSNRVTIIWQGHCVEAAVAYKTPFANVYDLAVLKCNPLHLKNLFIEQMVVSCTSSLAGEEVYSAGYPLFRPQLNPQPTISKGNISSAFKSVIYTTCCVLPGNSGGAIFRTNGEVVGIIVSNVKINETGVIYPRVNMAIPILSIYSIIQEFLATGDIEKLSALHTKDCNVINEWNYLSCKL